MTLLEIVNATLVKLRQTTVATTTESTYSTLVTQFVNEARREVEDAWNWLALRSTVSVTTSPSVSQYILTGVGNSRFKVMSVINDTDDEFMTPLGSNEMTKRFLFGDVPEGSPTHYAFNGFDSNGDPVVDLYPIPNDATIIRFNLVIPQNDTEAGGTVIKVPGHIVKLGAYVKALAEKGEESSNAYDKANAEYVGALSSNIAQEEALLPNETDWNAV